MGVCPQHDILFDSLTVREHLYLFAAFKGVSSKTIRQEVERMVDAVDLRAKSMIYLKTFQEGKREDSPLQ